MNTLNTSFGSVVKNDCLTRFRDDGYLIARRVIEPELAAVLAFESADILSQLISVPGRFDPRVTWWRSGNEYFVLKVKPFIDLGGEFSRLPSHAGLRSLLRCLLNVNRDAKLVEDKLLFKQRIEGPVAQKDIRELPEVVCKHTDSIYNLKRGWSKEVLTVVICLDDCPIESGPVQVWPGSHRRSFQHQETPDQGPIIPDSLAPNELSVSLLSTRGDVIVWHSGLVHASGPNMSGKPRRLLIMSFEPPDQDALSNKR